MPSAFKLRPVTSTNDLSAIREIVDSVFTEYGMTLDLASFDRDLTNPQEHYAAPQATFLIAEKNGTVCGMVGCHLEKDHGVLHRLYISPQARGMGLGKLLCSEMENWTLKQGRKEMQLWSDVRLTHAHAMYRNMGYKIFGSRTLEDPDLSVEFGMKRQIQSAPSPAPHPLTEELRVSPIQIAMKELQKNEELYRKALYAGAAILGAQKLAQSVAYDRKKFPVLPPLTALFATPLRQCKEEEIHALTADAHTILGFTNLNQTIWHPSCIAA